MWFAFEKVITFVKVGLLNFSYFQEVEIDYL